MTRDRQFGAWIRLVMPSLRNYPPIVRFFLWELLWFVRRAFRHRIGFAKAWNLLARNRITLVLLYLVSSTGSPAFRIWIVFVACKSDVVGLIFRRPPLI